jgi:nitroreductase
VRKYKEESVDKRLLEQIIDAGRMAPSAMNKQPWKFYIVSNKERLKKLSKAIAKAAENNFHLSLKTTSKEEDPIFHDAPMVIFITAPRNNEWAPIDIGMCAQNTMLAAKSFGYDSCPIGLAQFIEKTNAYADLPISSSEKVVLAIALGYGNEKPEIHERKKDNLTYVR